MLMEVMSLRMDGVHQMNSTVRRISKKLLTAFSCLRGLCVNDRDLHIRVMTDNTTCVNYINEMGG